MKLLSTNILLNLLFFKILLLIIISCSDGKEDNSETVSEIIDCSGIEGGSAVEDALGVCNGKCLEDIDKDKICDNEDSCVGKLDSKGECSPISLCDNNDVVINEIHSQGNPTDWIELKNTSTIRCHLEGWKVYDENINLYSDIFGDGSDDDNDQDRERDHQIVEFSKTATIEPKGLLILQNDKKNEHTFKFEFLFGIGKGDTVYLKSPTHEDSGIV